MMKKEHDNEKNFDDNEKKKKTVKKIWEKWKKVMHDDLDDEKK